MKSFVEFLKEDSSTKDLITQVKSKIKDIGIDAKVRQAPGRKHVLQVYTKTFDSKFSEDDKQKVLGVLHNLGLKGPMGTDLSKVKTTDSNNIEGYL